MIFSREIGIQYPPWWAPWSGNQASVYQIERDLLEDLSPICINNILEDRSKTDRKIDMTKYAWYKIQLNSEWLGYSFHIWVVGNYHLDLKVPSLYSKSATWWHVCSANIKSDLLKKQSMGCDEKWLMMRKITERSDIISKVTLFSFFT